MTRTTMISYFAGEWVRQVWFRNRAVDWIVWWGPVRNWSVEINHFSHYHWFFCCSRFIWRCCCKPWVRWRIWVLAWTSDGRRWPNFWNAVEYHKGTVFQHVWQHPGKISSFEWRIIENVNIQIFLILTEWVGSHWAWLLQLWMVSNWHEVQSSHIVSGTERTQKRLHFLSKGITGWAK